ncbi:BamA/TamA family outer membrane protein [Urechidicola vernalis]|uniref:BamA/TamA family outer membrane protein n=1 Tax=Urechidicola vernalis TaxID=3075600 RepID=A0ABU2Y179_9FLAO|nr:BamA/TamA family outer membrane protein [Urechidicola sp. P050]MDT0551933.1 BamA/TamA family outer membrane protein [Urechidicola sp. P050]
MRYTFQILIIFITCSLSAQDKSNKDSIDNKDKKVSLVGIPMINYSNSFGASFGAYGSGFYHTQKNDTVSPLSSSGVIGMYTTNKTWFAGQLNKLYFNEDKLRIKTAIGAGNINFQTYVSWPSFMNLFPINVATSDDDGKFIDYSTSMFFAYAEILFKTYKDLYVGTHFVYSHSETDFDLPLAPNEIIDQFGFGISFANDSRNNQLAPTEGIHAKFNTLSFLEDFGSTNSYTKLNMEYTHYFPIKERNTVLARYYGDISTGDVPFAGQNVVGRDDLRGYSNGKFRGNQVHAIQSEYRHWFADRWGFVAFGGVATAVDYLSEVNIGDMLPAAGFGVRFLAIPKSKINIGIDVAAGKDDWGIYFRIGEAFTR